MKRSKNKFTAAILCASIIILSLTGCSSSSDMSLVEEETKTEIKFSWWGPDSRNQYTIDAINKFEKENPNIKVKLEYSEFTGFQLKTDIKMAAHTEADVMQLNYSWVDGYSPDGNSFYDLYQLSDTLNLSNYTEEVLSYGTIEGKLNALPIAQNGQVFIYNEDIYQKYGLDIPDSWEDLFAAAKVMNKDGIYPVDIGSVALWFISVAHQEQISGKEIITSDNHFNFDKQDIQQMISFYKELIDNGVCTEISKRSDENISSGTAAGTVQWINSSEKFSAMIESSGAKSIVGPTPIISGATRTGWYVRPATMYAVSANSKNPKEAAMLLEYLVSSQTMTLNQLLDKGIPFNQEAKQILDENDALQGIMNDAANVIDNTETILMNPNFENAALNEAFYSACASVIYGESNLEDAADTAYNAMNAVFE